jgi:hypothetical protein
MNHLYNFKIHKNHLMKKKIHIFFKIQFKA